MRGEDVVLLPFIDEGIDFGGDELLQDAAGFVVVGGKEHVSIYPCHSGASAKRANPDSHLRY